MRQDFKYKSDKRTKWLSGILAFLALALMAFFIVYSHSGYFPVWFVFFLGMLLLLCVLSIPRKVRVTDRHFEIRCVIELTSIALEDIVSVRKMERKEMRYSFPLLASYGFFGYYGWFYNFSEMSVYKVYARQWKKFVRIDDIYETTYVVSCDDPEALAETITRAKKAYLESGKATYTH